MIGSIYRCRKIFLLLVILLAVLAYTFFNREYLNPAGRGLIFQKPDYPREDIALQESHIKRNEDTQKQLPDKTNPPEHEDMPHIIFKTPFPVENKERKDPEDRMDEENTENSSDNESGIPGPHHGSPYGHLLVTQDKEITSKHDNMENSSQPKSWNILRLKNNIEDESGDGRAGVLFQTTKPHESKDSDSENQHENDKEMSNNIEDERKYSVDDLNNLRTEQMDDSKKIGIGVLQQLLNDKPNSRPHPYTICPFLGLRGNSSPTNASINVKCKMKTSDETACKEAYVAYKNDQLPLQCEKLQDKNEICSHGKDKAFKCDMSVCRDKYVYLTGVDSRYGIVRSPKKSKIAISSNRQLEQLLYNFFNASKKNGFNFCFLKCRSKILKHSFVEQLIMFPPRTSNDSDSEHSLININIILLDSVSRPHFYRSMHKSVQTLRQIVHDPNIDATVLDFELFQSMADYTFHNIRVFMSGKTDFNYKEHKEQHYEIEHLFKHMKSIGYHTLLQEDSCWYDEWGSLYTDNLFQGKKPENLKDFKVRWKKFKRKIKNYYIDDYGLSHFSCEALERYNITNQFNQPKKICFGGQVFAEYFLSYNERVFNESVNSPILAYTHLNTGHEVSGTRIKQIDSRLSDFFRNMAEKKNTLTLVFSDHGPKTTRYAFRTMNGRAEIYDSLMFLIVPEKVASFLGYQRTKALVTNQKRLITAQDLHNTIMSFGNPLRENSGSYRLEGVFAEVPPNRTCADVPIKDSAICKCEGWDEFFATNHPPFIWLAELALGTLNNRIQNEYTTGADGIGGFGRCQRLTGRRFEKVRRRAEGNKYKVTMDLIVNPEDEIFEVQIQYPINPSRVDNKVIVSHLSRISIYRRFEKCKDERVDITHCVCKSRKSTSRNRWIAMDNRKNLLRILNRSENFGAKLKYSDLHASCLIMVTRTHSSRMSVFEIANACTNREYRVEVTGKSRGKAITSTSFPITLQLKPLTVHFLFSVYHLEKPYGFKATTSYKAYFVDLASSQNYEAPGK